jgi:pilus assembly protein CpaB
LIVLLLAVVTGGAAGWLALTQLRQQGRTAVAAEPKSGKVRLAVAARDLPVGTLLRTEDVRLVDWPGDVLPIGYASSTADVVGRGLMTPVKANEPLMSGKLADREAGNGLPILIPEGMRAVSVKVDEVIAVAGYVTPYTRVDVLVTASPDGQNAPPVSRVILQNVQTLAAGQSIERDADGKPQTVSVVTLLVTPEDGERLVLAATQGRIQLALRNPLDVAEARTSGVSATALVSAPRAAPATRATTVQPRRNGGGSTVVETYRGGVRTLNTF